MSGASPIPEWAGTTPMCHLLAQSLFIDITFFIYKLHYNFRLLINIQLQLIKKWKETIHRFKILLEISIWKSVECVRLSLLWTRWTTFHWNCSSNSWGLPASRELHFYPFFLKQWLRSRWMDGNCLWTSVFKCCHRYSLGFKSGLWLGHSTQGLSLVRPLTHFLSGFSSPHLPINSDLLLSKCLDFFL